MAHPAHGASGIWTALLLALSLVASPVVGCGDEETSPSPLGGGAATTSTSGTTSAGGSGTTSSSSTTTTTSTGGATLTTAVGGDAGAGGEGGSSLDPNGDYDQDGILNGVDNCPLDANPCQKDKDHDGIGDECDPSCDETCYGTNCGWPGIQGCNCGGCPSGYACVYDTHYDDGICNDDTYYHVCAERCDSTDPCAAGTCIKLFGSNNCICWTISMTTEPCDH